MTKLTKTQATILNFIKEAINTSGMPPTRQEIAKHFNYSSPNAAEQHLRALARKGKIELIQGASRGIRVLEQESDMPELLDTSASQGSNGQNEANGQDSQLPVVGQVAAGIPILAVEHIETYQPVNPAIFHPRADYLLRVKGMSMRDAGILDGDLLAVHRTQDAENNQVVVARVDDEEVTVKRFKRYSDETVLLKPENPEFQTIIVNMREQSLVIEGLGVGVIRAGQAL